MSRAQTPRRRHQPLDDLGGVLGAGEIEQLANEDFRQEEFLEKYLKGGNAAQQDTLRQLKSRFTDASDIAESGLKKSVFKNYSDFIIIAKEISAIEGEMLELKQLFEEWSTIPDSLDIQWSDERSSVVSTAGRRNSIADLTSLYRAQLVALWEGVENAEKLVPYSDGRHVVAQSSAFVELHSGTHKPRQAVSLFLLNDALLIATKKNKAGLALPAKGADGTTKRVPKLVADRLFHLNEVVVLDLKDTGDIRNAFQIKRAKEHVVFCTEKPDEKRALLAAFKKVAEEIINKRRREKEELDVPSASMQDVTASANSLAFPLASAAPSTSGNNNSIITTSLANLEFASGPPALKQVNPAQVLGLSEQSNKGLAWVGDLSDELSMAIASRMFEKAVAFYEKGRSLVPYLESDRQAHYLLTSQLDQQADALVAVLLRDLAQPSQTKQGIVRTTDWLVRLGHAEHAREAFLAMRGTVAKTRARQIQFEGDPVAYISNLALVYFTCIKNTCDWYLAAFDDGRMASGFVKWASAQMEVFAELFRRQMYGADQPESVVKDALRVTQAHGIMLRDVGLDFNFLLQSLLRPSRR